MKASDEPTKIQLPFANGAGSSYIRTVPVASQIGVTAGAASYTDGFPPDTFVPQSAGGYPPDGRDVNYMLQIVTAWARWMAAGGELVFDSTFASEIGGYPNGAILAKADGSGFWQSTADDNSNDPDTGGANWHTIALSEYAADQRYAALAGSGTQTFAVANGTTGAQAVAFQQFGSSLATNGYQKLPNGRIEQWGFDPLFSLGGNASASHNITYPIAFPNQVLNVQCTLASGQAGSQSNLSAAVEKTSSTGPTTSGFFIYYDNLYTSSRTIGAYWVAYGN